MINKQAQFCCAFLSVFFLINLTLLSGCKSGPKVEEFLLGSWRMNQGKVHSILSFHANGSWILENRVEGKLSKIVAKKGKISGEWFYTDELEGGLPEGQGEKEKKDETGKKNEAETEASKPKIFLVMSVIASDDEETGWQKGVTKPFEIVELNKDRLVLKGFDDMVMEWMRVSSSGKNTDEVTGGTIKASLGSIIVNLSRTQIRHKRRYLCLDVDIILEVPYEEGTLPPAPPKLHPRVREAAIFYLSSKTYQELRTVDKAQEILNELKDVLNPYLENKIQELVINTIIITTERKIVEDYENQLLKPQKVEESPEEVEEDSKVDAEA
ncbi:MAG: flagellar basal body-associated FliL family protein [Proteobacteria bacterium]|nr:flagellar basal body-associated FliL family protein [Pseudomonadota bacterium]